MKCHFHLLRIYWISKRVFSVIKQMIRFNLLGKSLFFASIFSTFQVLDVAKSESNYSIVAVEPVACDLVKKIVPKGLDVKCLLDNSDDPHYFMMSPKKLSILGKADQIITIGSLFTPQINRFENNSTLW